MTPAKRRREWIVIEGGKKPEPFQPFLPFEIFFPWFWWRF
jgi:hypothetical protein